MTFRTRLLLVSSLTVAGAVALVSGAVSGATRRAFDRISEERRKGVTDQFQREVISQDREVEDKVQRAAASGAVQQIAVEANKSEPDFSTFVDEARAQADAQALDFLDILQPDLTIISSASAPARFGYKSDWLIAPDDVSAAKSFLTRIPTDNGTAVAFAAVHAVSVGDKSILVVGARKLDPPFLASLGVAPGVRAMLWLASGEVMDASGPVANQQNLAGLLDTVRRTRQKAFATVQWTRDPATAESIVALPLVHGDTLLGALLVGTSLREQVLLEKGILWTGIGVGGAGILLGVLIGFWTTLRVTRPVAQLVSGVEAVAGGDWNTRVRVQSGDEIGQLAGAFNKMTEQLIEQRDRAIQAERVAAWRELARRLAHELKNPLFPLQITIENLQRARERHAEEFDEVFRESTATLLAEMQNLKTIVGQFSDFAKMPPPEFEAVNASALVREVMKLFEAQFHAEGRPCIEPMLELAEANVEISADPLQLSRALRNLMLNAMDAMPEGGTLRVSTEADDGTVRIAVSDSGQGLSEEECARLFTPYYTTKRHGTGLGLAIVQSVVSDHHGRISVSGQPGRGATFTIELPARRNA
jgi:signal transduction histidine kinase